MSQRGFNLIEWSVKHPSAVLAFYTAVIVLAIWAVVAYLPRRMMPYIESPQIGIVTRVPGLSAEDMETYYTKPIEQRMTAIAGVRYIPQHDPGRLQHRGAGVSLWHGYAEKARRGAGADDHHAG
ncbi:MAG: hypothetical protein KatS3mg021_0518 [Fimbriimonadales bacterium]|nr:MAG: hypothetical protein KatS3mg021_0518 [Fimbriimonadales bacterium]